MIYLAAPYSAPTEQETEQRMQVFGQVASDLIRDGEIVVSPLFCHFIRHYNGLPGDWNYWKRYSETLLVTCNELVIIDMPGWKDSSGVQGEIQIARERNIPCSLYNTLTKSRKPL